MSVDLHSPPMQTSPLPTRPLSEQPYLSPEADLEHIDDYRALSTAAIAGLALGILSALAILDWWLLAVPVAAVIVGLAGLRQISREPEQFVGRGIAIAGIALALLVGLGAAGWHGYVYATEVPEGFRRIDYGILQPHKNDPPDRIPPEALALDGEQVFIKGYVYPGSQTKNIRTFLLVRDQGDCCFGGNPKVTDRIQVQLGDVSGLTFSSRLFKVAGKFRIDRQEKAYGDAPGAVFYHLEEAQLR